jgi:uncharacterized hydrophobic protein (TIGR00341 family)
MALRLMELILPRGDEKEALDLMKDRQVQGVWQEKLADDLVLIRVLTLAEETEALFDLLENRFAAADGFRVILFPVEASLPRPVPPEEAAPETETVPAEPPPGNVASRISREELYEDITDSIRVSAVFLVMVVLSAIVAAIGLLRGNVAIIIGAMVIAPLLGPNVALSLATTLADGALARNSLKAGLAGMSAALAASLALGFVFSVDPGLPEIASRTQVSISDVGLALASGVAGALAFTTGVPGTLIGVMVAVALLPPLVAFGMLLGAGHWQHALGALLLLATNVICVNLAGVVTFLAQGIRPASWSEADRAKRASGYAIAIWVALLAALAAVITLSQRR